MVHRNNSRQPLIETRRRHTSTSWRVRNRNDPLSKLEIGSVHASVKSAQRDLTELEHDLARAQRTVQTLTASRKTLRKFIASERALLSPIRSLPRELLSEIFVHHARRFAAHRDYIVAALVVSQVCAGWRGVAHATAVLWVRFPLYYCPGYSSIVPEIQVAMYTTWISRAASLPCDVALRKAPASMVQRARGDDPEEGFVCLEPRGYYDSRRYMATNQWSKLDIEYNFQDSLNLNFVSSVRSVTIHIPQPDNGKRRSEVINSAPKLEELVLRCPTENVLNPVFLPIVPLNAVKRCEMGRFPLTNGLQILDQAKELETLKWTTAFSDTEDEDAMSAVTTNIRTLDLSIWGIHDSGLSPLFDNLTAPQLETLRILWIYRSDWDIDYEASPAWYSGSVLAFLSRSAASLTSLTLLHANMCEAQLIALLEHTPLLVQFDLSDRYARRDDGIEQMLGAQLLSRLFPPAAGASVTGLVPKLEVLKLRGGFEGNDMCDADIMRVFEARCPSESDEQTEYARLTDGALHLLRRADQQPGGALSLSERAARLRVRGLNFEFTTREPDPYDAEEDEETCSEGEMSS